MTKVAQIFEREKQEAIAKVIQEKEDAVSKISQEKDAVIAKISKEKDEAIAKQTIAFKMLLHGDTVIHISQVTGMSEDEIEELMK